MFNYRKRAFTLIELMVAVLIIGIIVSLSTIYFYQIKKKNRDYKRLSDVSQLQLALENYKFFEGAYPTELTPSSTLSGPVSGKIFLDKIPVSPDYDNGDWNTTTYLYSYNENINKYELLFYLESRVENYKEGGKIASPSGIVEWNIRSDWSCGHGVVDTRDYKVYSTVQIGTQCWMSQSMNYDNGCTSNSWINNVDTGWCGCLNDNSDNCAIRGKLYQWSAAMNNTTTAGAQGVCPTGWHIPIWDEIETLRLYLASPSNHQYQCNGYVAKSLAAVAFNSTNDLASWYTNSETCSVGNIIQNNNSSGFNGLPSGERYIDGNFYGYEFLFWSSTSYLSDKAYYRGVTSYGADLSCCAAYRASSKSVRCLKNP